MSKDFEQKAITDALNRRVAEGQTTPELKAFNEAQNDWYGVCRHCKQPVSGSIASLKAHVCVSEGK